MMESSPAEEMLKKGDFACLAALCEQEELQVRYAFHYIVCLGFEWPQHMVF